MLFFFILCRILIVFVVTWKGVGGIYKLFWVMIFPGFLYFWHPIFYDVKWLFGLWHAIISCTSFVSTRSLNLFALFLSRSMFDLSQSFENMSKKSWVVGSVYKLEYSQIIIMPSYYNTLTIKISINYMKISHPYDYID